MSFYVPVNMFSEQMTTAEGHGFFLILLSEIFTLDKQNISFIHPFIHSSIHSFIHSFTHSFFHNIIQLSLFESSTVPLNGSSSIQQELDNFVLSICSCKVQRGVVTEVAYIHQARLTTLHQLLDNRQPAVTEGYKDIHSVSQSVFKGKKNYRRLRFIDNILLDKVIQ